MPVTHRVATVIYNTLLFLLLFGMIFSTSVNIYLFTSAQQTARNNRELLCSELVLHDSKYCAVIKDQIR